MKQYTLTVSLQEDMHTGSGTGAGEYDALIARDSQNKPVIPSSHWLGVWRDNLHRYLKETGGALDSGYALLGKTDNQRKAVTATALYCKSEPPPTLPWTSTSREEFSRVTKENTLRTREFIPAGSEFEATLLLADESLECLLYQACRITDRLGARRQRGDGYIRASLTETSPEPVSLQRHPKSAVVRLLLRSRDPLCLPVTGTPGNIIESECYIRGQVLRGAVIGALLRRGDTDVAKELFNNKVTFSNAYSVPITKIPEDKSWLNWSVEPMPLHFGLPKPGGSGSDNWPWWAMEEDVPAPVDQLALMDNDREKLKRPPDNSFIFHDGGQKQWTSFNAPLRQRMRNAQPSPEHPEGALFAQQEIPENSLFLAEIDFSIAENAHRLMPALQNFLHGQDCLNIGRGGKPLTIEAWADAPKKAKHPDSDPEQLTITLTSDLIARNQYLGFYDRLTLQVLLSLCGLSIADFPDAKDWQCRAFCDHLEVHGFNAMTGLPRLPVLVIRRGSCLHIKGKRVDRLRQALIKQDCLGEGRHEGFGRFRLDFAPVVEIRNKRTSTIDENTDEAIYTLAEKAFKEIKNINIDNWPKLAQWQILRYNDAERTGNLFEMITKYRDRLETKKNQNNASKIAWLQPGPGQSQSWIDWLIVYLNRCEPNQQRLFYRALLALVRRRLRQQRGEHGS